MVRLRSQQSLQLDEVEQEVPRQPSTRPTVRRKRDATSPVQDRAKPFTETLIPTRSSKRGQLGKGGIDVAIKPLPSTVRVRQSKDEEEQPRTAKRVKSTPPLNPTTTDFEFFGPHATIFVVLSLPLAVFMLHQLCNQENGCRLPTYETLSDMNSHLFSIFTWFNVVNMWDTMSFVVVLGWFSFHILLYLVIPGPFVDGVTLRDGSRLKYKINAFRTFVATCVAGVGIYLYYGFQPFSWVAMHVPQLALSAMLFATALAIRLYIFSFRKRDAPLLSIPGNSGYPIYDFWMGRELNPRSWCGLDWKYFCELRPGLIGWLALNACYAIQQYLKYGQITNSMILVLAFQTMYVVDALWFEPAILTTMDITTDGFGFMLVFGDLCWVPFTYTLQARYLSMNPVTLSWSFLAVIMTLNAIGLYIFRGANSEKNAFRSLPSGHPSIAHLRYIQTKAGSRLLISGWWGQARHINYFGDWMMGVAWCLPCAFGSPLPYFYAIYFAILLMHREGRDEHKCRLKYGSDWDVYCRAVPCRFIPGVY